MPVEGTLYHVVYDMPRRPSELAELHKDVDAALVIALAKNPDDRFFTAFEFADALAAAFEGTLDDEWRDCSRRLGMRHSWSGAT